MRRSRFVVSPAAVVVAVVAATVGCGGLTTPAGHTSPTLFEVRGRVSGELGADVAGELRAALSWSVFDRELIDCVADIDVDGPLDWIVDDDDARTAEALDRCLTFSARGRSETASVPLQPSLPASFSIPVDVLPDPSLLSGDEGARLGIAGVLIYTDDDESGRFDETPLGASAFRDRVHGTSYPTSDDAERVTYLIYREGQVSPLWKLFVALYGCAEPPPGFSTVTVDLNQTSGTIACAVDDRAIDVTLGDLAHLGCAEDPGRDEMTRPTARGLPADSVAICDSSNDLYVTTSPDSVCPSFTLYTLFGCDLTSEASCRATFWDLQDAPPDWWPCREGSRTLFNIIDPVEATDGDDAHLFSLRFRNGTPVIPMESLAITLVVGDAPITFRGRSLTLIDNDDNGAFNTGDIVHVGEVGNEVTRQTVPPGTYAVRIEGLDDAEVFGAWIPFPLPELATIEVTAEDAPGVVTDGVDDLVIVTSADTTGAAPRPFAGLSGTAYLGGELPLRLSAHVHHDANGDGLFDPGDQVMLRDIVDGDGAYESVTIEAWRAFGGTLSIELASDVGVDSPRALAFTMAEVQ